MEGFLSKLVWLFIKLFISIPLVVWSLFSKNHESEVYEFMKDSGLDSVFDFFSGGFMCFIGFIKIEGVQIDIHGTFQAIFFYIGGISATIWALFRLKLAFLDHQIKSKQLSELEKSIKIKDKLLNDFEKNIDTVVDLKQYLKDK